MNRCPSSFTGHYLYRLYIGLLSALIVLLIASAPTQAQPAPNIAPRAKPLQIDIQAGVIPQAQEVVEDVEEKLEEFPAEGNWGAFPRMDRQTLRESLFGALGGSEAAFHKLKRESIRREVDRINSICSLTDEQMAKLNEAIEVDIQHIATRIESILSGFDPKLTMQELQVLHQEVYTFASSVNSPENNATGVWKKVLRSLLSKEQANKMEEDEKLVAANKHRTRQMHLLLSLQRRIGLNASQRLKISQWLDLENRDKLDFPFLCKLIVQTKELTDILSDSQIKSLNSPPAKAIIIDAPAEIMELR